MLPGVEIKLRPYDTEVIRRMRLFADDVSMFSLSRSYVKSHPEVSTRIWRNAQRIVGTGAAWGSLVPGVSLDCIGSVITIVHMSGLYNIPKGVYARLGSSPQRGVAELNKQSAVIFRRMIAIFALMVWRYPCEGCVAVPVWNPKKILPGDVLLLPNYTVINGMVTMPHSIVAVGNDKIMTTNPESGLIQVVDGNIVQCDNSVVRAVNEVEDVMFAMRLLEGMDAESDIIKHHIATCWERIKELAEESDKDFLDEVTAHVV